MTRNQWLFRKGQRSFKIGAEMPLQNDVEDDKSEQFVFWAGYMAARALKLFKQFDAKNTLTDPDPFDPRPPNETGIAA